jgi:hypothetical protein
LALASSISFCFIFRDAWQISVVPLIRAAIHAPEPGPLTAILTLGCIFMNSSAQTVESGVTVLEPIILNEPDSSEPSTGAGVVGAASPQPLINTAAAINTKGIISHFIDFLVFNISS